VRAKERTAGDGAAGAARLSMAANAALIAMKIAVGVLSGSISIISEAIHSTIDLVASAIAYLSILLARKPADQDHSYGHEKIENVSGVVEAALIFLAAVLIVVEAVRKLIDYQSVDHIELGVLVMLVSGLVNILITVRLYKIARAERSVALEADALHHKTDIYSSMGVALGLAAILLVKRFLDAPWIVYLDPAVAILIAVFILKEAWEMIRTAFGPLIDESLEAKELERLEALVASYEGVAMHAVRSRRSGKTKYIDFHLSVDETMSVRQAHELCDEIERAIGKELSGSSVLIHVEPVLARGRERARESGSPLTKDDILVRLSEIGREAAGYEVGPHHLHIFDGGGWTELTFHINLKARTSVEEAHRVATAIERAVADRLGFAATIHVEPAKER
jgi:cation diffusion facilitator family transporter